MEKTKLRCPECGVAFTWEAIREENLSLEVRPLLHFLKLQTGQSFEEAGIKEAYIVPCGCEHGCVVMEYPKACEPDETGYSAPLYLLIAENNLPEPRDALRPLLYQKTPRTNPKHKKQKKRKREKGKKDRGDKDENTASETTDRRT